MEWVDVLKALASLLIVAALIGATAFLARRSGMFGQFSGMKRAGRMLSVEEVALLDTRHRAVLLRCGAKRHLVLLGPAAPLVVDTMSDLPNETEPV